MKPTNEVFTWGVVLLFPFLSGSTVHGCGELVRFCDDNPRSNATASTADPDIPGLFAIGSEGEVWFYDSEDEDCPEYHLSYTVPGEPYLADILLGDSPKGEFNIVVGDNGTIVRDQEGVPGWTVIPSPINQNLNKVTSSLGGSILIAVGDAGAIIRSVDYGLTWDLVPPPAPVDLGDSYINPHSEDFIQVVGEGLVLYQTLNGGFSWQAIPLGGANLSKLSGGGLNINRLYHQNDLTAYVVADGGVLIRTTDNFSSFENLDALTSENLNDIYFVSPDTGYVIGDSGTVRISVDGGAQWAEDPAITALVNGASLKRISVIDSLYAIVLGDSGLNITVARDSSIFTSVASEQEIATEYRLFQNYPNPFNPVTTFAFTIPYSSFATLSIYDLLGCEVATLVNEKLSPGRYERAFDASGLASGIYLYRLQVRPADGGYERTSSETRKLILLR